MKTEKEIEERMDLITKALINDENNNELEKRLIMIRTLMWVIS